MITITTTIITTITTIPSCRRPNCACARWRSILTEKGYVDPAALDCLIEPMRRRSARATALASSPRPGPIRPIAHGLLKDATRGDRRARLCPAGQGEHMVAVENTPEQHNMVVCTLCSCYPHPVLGLPPVWYKSAPYRSRAVTDPRGVLADFGVSAAGGPPRSGSGIPPPRSATSCCRCGPRAPRAGASEQLAELVTRDSMIGTGLPKQPGETA